MAFRTITPTMGGRRSHALVTLACRRSNGSSDGRGHYNFVYTISKELHTELGWAAKGFVLIQIGEDEDAGKVLITPTQSETDGWRLTLNKTALQGVVPLAARAETVIGAQAVPHEIVNGSLLVTLPIWAGGLLDIPALAPRAPRGSAAKAQRPVSNVSPILPRPAPFAAIAAGAKLGAVPPVKPVVLTPDEADDEEAIEMIRSGKSVRLLQDYFGWHNEAGRQRIMALRARADMRARA